MRSAPGPGRAGPSTADCARATSVGGLQACSTRHGRLAGHVAYWRESDRVLILGDVLNNIDVDTGDTPGRRRPDSARDREPGQTRPLGDALRPRRRLVCSGTSSAAARPARSSRLRRRACRVRPISRSASAGRAPQQAARRPAPGAATTSSGGQADAPAARDRGRSTTSPRVGVSRSAASPSAGDGLAREVRQLREHVDDAVGTTPSARRLLAEQAQTHGRQRQRQSRPTWPHGRRGANDGSSPMRPRRPSRSSSRSSVNTRHLGGTRVSVQHGRRARGRRASRRPICGPALTSHRSAAPQARPQHRLGGTARRCELRARSVRPEPSSPQCPRAGRGWHTLRPRWQRTA